MASLIEFAGIIGALMVSVLTGLLMAWLWFETFFRVVAPVRRFATPASEPTDPDDPPETASRSARRSH